MKKSIFLLATLLGSFFYFAPAIAGSVNCSGELELSGNFINGTCSGPFCTVFMPASSVSGSANCGPGVSVTLSDELQGSVASGNCNGSFFQALLPSEEVTVTGTCSNGGQFRGTAFFVGQDLFGTCGNGFFSANASPMNASLSGTCTTP